MLPYEKLLTKNMIWNIEQNKPSLIAKDLLLFGVPEKESHKILLARGVYKWLSVRRDLIKLKNVWRDRITQTIQKIVENKKLHNGYEVAYYRGYLKAYEECRKEVRELCHSERWRAPDFDKNANKILKEMEAK